MSIILLILLGLCLGLIWGKSLRRWASTEPTSHYLFKCALLITAAVLLNHFVPISFLLLAAGFTAITNSVNLLFHERRKRSPAQPQPHSHSVIAAAEPHFHHHHVHAHPSLSGGDLVHEHPHTHVGDAEHQHTEEEWQHFHAHHDETLHHEHAAESPIHRTNLNITIAIATFACWFAAVMKLPMSLLAWLAFSLAVYCGWRWISDNSYPATMKLAYTLSAIIGITLVILALLYTSQV